MITLPDEVSIPLVAVLCFSFFFTSIISAEFHLLDRDTKKGAGRRVTFVRPLRQCCNPNLKELNFHGLTEAFCSTIAACLYLVLLLVFVALLPFGILVSVFCEICKQTNDQIRDTFQEALTVSDKIGCFITVGVLISIATVLGINTIPLCLLGWLGSTSQLVNDDDRGDAPPPPSINSIKKKDGKKERMDIIDKVKSLFPQFKDDEKNIDRLFRSQWDSEGLHRHKQEWPEVFMKYMKALIKRRPTTPSAFQNFMKNEMKIKFKDCRAVTVPAK